MVNISVNTVLDDEQINICNMLERIVNLIDVAFLRWFTSPNNI